MLIGAALQRWSGTAPVADDATVTSNDFVEILRGWNLSLQLTSRRLWSELDLVPRYRSVLEGIPACLDGSVAFRWRHPVFDRS